MPLIQLDQHQIYYQTHGRGQPLVLLHAGWGTPVNGFEHQIDALHRQADRFRLIIPHRLNYGRSSRVEVLSPDYHREAVPHMLAVFDHAGVEAAHLWGHSDGAVVGAWTAILAPERVRSLVFEGGHLLARKEGERGHALMQRVRDHPESLPAEVIEALAAGHGPDDWKRILWLWTEAWRLLHLRNGDLYDGRLDQIACPTLVIHGGQDPHTPLSEMEALASQIPGAEKLLIPDGGHSLHDDPAWLETVHLAVQRLFGSTDSGQTR